MNKDKVAKSLEELSKSDKNRSDTARLRDIFENVEAAMSAGVSRTAILEILHANGFKLTLASFGSALYRIRHRREKNKSLAPRPSRGAVKKQAGAALPDSSGNAAIKTENPLKKGSGFEYNGTLPKDELI